MGENFQYLERTELQKKLSAIENVPLALVVAPMGYGKSTLIWKYLEHQQKQFLWIALGQTDVQEELLWNRIAREISSISKPLSSYMLQVGLPYGNNWNAAEDTLLTKMKDELTALNFYLVLDDYQSCVGTKITRFLSKLAYEDVENTHIILISRHNIDFPLEELRLKGYCTIITQADLMLSPTETKSLLELNQIVLDEETFQEIYTYTDGWIAAIRLLWLDYQETGGLQSFDSIQRLLRESIYLKLSGKEQSLLYPFTCFAELSLQELSVIINTPVTKKMMQQLMDKTGLLYYNAKNNTYNIHTLLCAVITEEGTGNPVEIFQRYARLQMQNQNYISALEYYRKANDQEAILQILDGEHRFELLEQLPDFLLKFFQSCRDIESVLRHPYAVLSYMYSMLLSADERILQEGRRFYTYLEDYYKTKAVSCVEAQNLLGELYIITPLLVFNDLEATNQALNQAWELRKGKPSRIFFKKIYSYGVPNTLFMYHKTPGELRKEADGEIRYSQQYMRLIYSSDASLEKLINAEYALEIGEIEAAYTNAREALELAEFRNQICIVISSYMVLLRCLIFQGNTQGFEQTFNQCKEFVEQSDCKLNMISSEYNLMCGCLYTILGQLDKVPLWLRDRQLDSCNLIIRDSRYACTIYGIYLCRKKSWIKLIANAEEMMVSYAGTRHVFSEIYAYVFYSIAHWYTGEEEKSYDFLLKAIDLASPDGIILPFAEMSEELLPLFEMAKAKHHAIKKLELYCKQWRNGANAFKNQAHKETLLTPREKELMELLAQSYRNSEIGNRMHIAQITVEKNLTNIYRKIGVTNRTGAVKWYIANKSEL